MSSVTIWHSPAKKAQRALVKPVLALLVGCAAGLLAAGTWFYLAASAALPLLDGTLAIAGLSQPVTVTRDAQGVPHITAANLDDLYFAQGFVTAQDRLWQ